MHFLITRQNRKRLRAFVSVEELTILARNVRFSCMDIERDAETRPVPNVDEAAFDDRVRQPVDNFIPPLRLAHRILEADVVLRQDGRHMNMCGEPYQPVENPVGSDEDAVKIGVFRDPLQFRYPTYILRVWADYVDSLFFDEILEVLPEVDLFSGVNRDRSTLRHFPKNIGVGVRRVVARD